LQKLTVPPPLINQCNKTFLKYNSRFAKVGWQIKQWKTFSPSPNLCWSNEWSTIGAALGVDQLFLVKVRQEMLLNIMLSARVEYGMMVQSPIKNSFSFFFKNDSTPDIIRQCNKMLLKYYSKFG